MTFIENRIREILLDMDILYWKFCNFQSENSNQTTEKLKNRFIVQSQKVYKLIFCYFEQNNLPNYLHLFKKNIGNKLEQQMEIFENKRDIDSIGSDFVNEIWDYLSAFDNFSKDSTDFYLKRSGIIYLKNILSNTASIILNSTVTPQSESDVYNTVKKVIFATFPTSKNAGSNFLKIAKEYKPDILIPELNVAIEYKYAVTETKLKATIEQIAADVVGYTGDEEYKLFFCVFYVTKDFWGLKRFEKIWKEQNFPANWQAFYIIGN